MRTLSIGLTIGATLVCSRAAAADPVDRVDDYGLTVLAGYGAPMAITWTALVIGSRHDDNLLGLAVVGEAAVLLTPVIIHVAHHNAGAGLASLGGNLGFSVVGALAGFALGATRCQDGPCHAELIGGFAGATVFQAFWAIIDANGLAHREVGASTAIVPVIAGSARAPCLGVGGEF